MSTRHPKTALAAVILATTHAAPLALSATGTQAAIEGGLLFHCPIRHSYDVTTKGRTAYLRWLNR